MGATSRGHGEARTVKPRVLIVDDEPNIVLSLQFLMNQAGFEVTVARDGEAAMAALGGTPPDVAILDVMIPNRDGFELCESIRSTPRLKHTKVILLTAKSGEVERARALDVGADDYVTKPFSTRELVERVKKLLVTP